MTSKQHGKNAERDENGKWLPGARANPRGRPKGSKNVFNMQLRDCVWESFLQLGGVRWLVKLGNDDPKVFCSLLARLLPPEKGEQSDDRTIIVVNGGPDAAYDDD
ncbi:hypothetical protein HFU84_09210 [Acidithiobacillus sp. CV18-2]|nr:hypothetical protein [Acidithiobacillus sp. CV18-3]MBU2757349.1 hypothetical protein [Acidithiobacillus sp. BN09-2]MBU2776072.1 hypothetical protein [Acidithiobacillus sp. CV18-2]MBU2799393.1 hypothetical protein [Acidithiobacillus sp. VAN18-4]MBU2755612.1 hypothetical protein [Acidithiobacillus sp. CV18-3]